MADNMLLMATIHVIMEKQLGNVYVGIVQACFFIAYALLAPYAGILSERVPKAQVLWMGNVLKMVGATFLFVGGDPAVSYALAGIGACVYGPGKFAILREITSKEEELYKANGLVEGSTIIAILIGTVLGGFLSSKSFILAMVIILLSYVISFIFAWILPRGEVSPVSYRHAWRNFFKDIQTLFHIREAKSAIIGGSSFWMTSAVLRLSVIAWIPMALHLGEDKASLYMGISAIGIMTGAILSPKIIPLHRLERIFYIGAGMSLCIAIVGWFPHILLTGILLYLAGFFGGAYMIPLNTKLQEKGVVVGNGKTIAIQNFFENVLMISGTLVYTGALKIGVSIPVILVGFACLFFVIVFFVKTSFQSLSQ
jgi:MFS transporter, LPLT family, lysophospholipid transporter